MWVYKAKDSAARMVRILLKTSISPYRIISGILSVTALNAHLLLNLGAIPILFFAPDALQESSCNPILYTIVLHGGVIVDMRSQLILSKLWWRH